MIDMAKRLEGLPNHTSVHAAGVVIYPGVASDYVPLGRANDGSPTAEYNMVQLEELGLLKMDFSGASYTHGAKGFCEEYQGIKGH